MILYADTGALVKRYVQEVGTEEVLACFTRFEMLATAAVTQVEMAAALAKASRQGWIDAVAAQEAWHDFLQHWPTYVRLPVSALNLERAARLAWKHGLRAYDALHLACVLIWQESAMEGLLLWPEEV